METSDHFDEVSKRSDRISIKDEWVGAARDDPACKEFQENGRVKHWSFVPEAGRWLRVVLLEDRETVHTKFWDRAFPEKLRAFEEGKEWRMVRYRQHED